MALCMMRKKADQLKQLCAKGLLHREEKESVEKQFAGIYRRLLTEALEE